MNPLVAHALTYLAVAAMVLISGWSAHRLVQMVYRPKPPVAQQVAERLSAIKPPPAPLFRRRHIPDSDPPEAWKTP